jgi:hypothetical protein
MAKALCMTGMVIAILVAILFLADLAAQMPFGRANIVMDVTLLVCALLLGVLSWFTLREQG